MNDIQVIVNGFNQEPFRKNLTLVQFDELSPAELLEMLNEVFANLSDEHAIDLREEDPEQTAFRMSTFLRVLNYRPQNVNSPEELGELLVQKLDQQAIYAVLHFLFLKLPDLRKRAYLARYLVDPGIPQDVIASDDEILQTYQQYKEMQREFTRIHKMCDQLRHQIAPPEELKAKISEEERQVDELEEKIERIKRQLDHEDPEAFLAAASDLRRGEDEKQKLEASIKEQKEKAKGEADRCRVLNQQVADFKEIALHGSPMQIIQAMEIEMEKSKHIANVELPKEIKGKQVRLEQVQKSLAGESYTNFAIEELTKSVEAMKKQVRDLEKKKLEPAANDRLHQFRPNAQAVAARKKDQRSRLRLLQEERDELAGKLQEKEDEFKSLGDQKVLTGEEFKRYAAQLREKHGHVKRTKVEEQEIKSELTVLNRTEQILSNRCQNVDEALKKLEQEKGVGGYMNTQAELAKVSTQKQEVDEQKGHTLEQMSNIVMELTQKIKDQKLKLKEPIKDLKYVLRPKYKELGEEYKDKKSQYEHEKHNEEKEINSVRTAVKDLEEECIRDETRWHQQNARMQINQVLDLRLKPIERREPGKEDSVQKPAKSYKELYSMRQKTLQEETDKVRKIQKDVKRDYQPQKEQMAMLQDCSRLLQCKRHCLKLAQNDGSGAVDENGSQFGGGMVENHLVL